MRGSRSKVIGTLVGLALGLVLLLTVLRIPLPTALLLAVVAIAATWFVPWADRLAKARSSRTDD